MRSAPAIAFECRPSPRLAWWLRLMLLLAWLALALTELGGWSRLGLAVLAGAIYGRARWHLWHPPLRALAWSNDGWQAMRPGGAEIPANLLDWREFGDYRWLYLQLAGVGRYGLLLGPDNLDADSLRQLCMRLPRAHAGGGRGAVVD